MNRLISFSLVTAVVLAVSGSYAAPALQTATDQVRAARAAWNDAYNAGDIDRLMQQYTDDAVSMAPGDPAKVGKAAVKADIAGFLAANTVHETADIKDIMIEGDLAVERANYTAQITPKSGKAFTEHGKHIVAYRRGPDGKWRVKWEIWNSDVPEK